MILASKVLALRDPEALKKLPQLYRLASSPEAIAAYVLRLWNRAKGKRSSYILEGLPK